MGLLDLRVTVVGLGLIGGSLALGLVGKVAEVRGVDLAEETLYQAKKRRMADLITNDATQALAGSDVVVVALYPQQAKTFIKTHHHLFSPGTLIMDVAGIKENIVEEIQSLLPPDLEFLGTHPMAGREGQGIGQAREELFLGTTYLLTPTDKNSPQAISLATSLIELLGVDRIVRLRPKEHDLLVAYTSQLPHVLAALLMQGIPDGATSLVGGSFKDATRVATINTHLWVELFLENKENLLVTLSRYQKTMTDFQQALEDGDRLILESILDKAKENKEQM